MLHVACWLVTALSVFVKYFTHLPPKNCANTLPHRTERAQLVARLLAALHHNGWQLVSRLLPQSRCAKCRGILFNFIFIFFRFFFLCKNICRFYFCVCTVTGSRVSLTASVRCSYSPLLVVYCRLTAECWLLADLWVSALNKL